MKNIDIEKILNILDNTYDKHVMDTNYGGNPYKALVSCLLSLRTMDEITFPIADKLFEVADNPAAIANMPYEELCSIIKSINYYKTKAQKIQQISTVLLEKYGGNVPDTIDELLTLHGVGRKTANIVLGVGFGRDSIAVDTHVHRISNRMGYVSTKTPEQTEFALREKLPKPFWKMINQLFVLHGKNTCRPNPPTVRVLPRI